MFGVKVKLSVDPNGKKRFQDDILKAVGIVKLSKDNFEVTKSAGEEICSKIKEHIKNNQFEIEKISVKKIDVSDAVKNVKKELEVMLSALSVKNGVNIAGIKDFIDVDDVKKSADAMREAAQKAAEAKEKAAGYAAELKLLKTTSASVSSEIKKLNTASIPDGAAKEFDNLKKSFVDFETLYNKVEDRLRNGVNVDEGDIARLKELSAQSIQFVTNIKAQIEAVGKVPAELAGKMSLLAEVSSKLHKDFNSLNLVPNSKEEQEQINAIVNAYQDFLDEREKIINDPALIAKGDGGLQKQAARVYELIAALQKLRSARSSDVDASNKQYAATKDMLTLQKQMQSFLNANSRVTNTEYGSQIKKFITEITSAAPLTKDRLKEIATEFSNIKATATIAGITGKSAVEQIRIAYEKFGGWQLVSKAIQKIIDGIKKMITNVRKLDAAMTELRKVTDETDSTYDAFLDKAADRAKALGATLNDTVSATSDFARLGYDLEDASALADAAMVYKNVGDGINDISTASESIISTMQAFGIEAANAMSIVDKFNLVGNRFAISSKGIGDALVRSASAMASAGNTIDETVALITVANEIVQNPESVGTTLKTLSMYLRAAKTEAEEAGESTEGMASSVSELREQILSLTGGKVDIQIDENNFKSTYQIMKELSSVWEELTDISQANILEMISGKRNANVVSAILSNFADAEKALQTSLHSEGSALEENEKYIDSINGKIAQLLAAFEDLSTSAINSDLFKGAVDTATRILDTITEITETLGGTKTVVASIVGLLAAHSSMKDGKLKIFSLDEAGGTGLHVSDSYFAKLIKNFNSAKKAGYQFRDAMKLSTSGVWENITDAINQFNNLGNASAESQKKFRQELDASDTEISKYLKTIGDGGEASIGGFVKHCKAGGVSVSQLGAKSIAAAVGVEVLNAAVSMGVSLLISAGIQFAIYLSQYKENMAEAIRQTSADIQDSYDSATESIKSNMNTLNGLQGEFAALSKGVDDYGNNISLTADEYDRYKEIVSEILDISPSLIEGYDSEGNAIANKNNLLERSIELLKEEQRLRLKEYASEESMVALGLGAVQDIKDYKKEIKKPAGDAGDAFAEAFMEGISKLHLENHDGNESFYQYFNKLLGEWGINETVAVNTNFVGFVKKHAEEIYNAVKLERERLSSVLSQDEISDLFDLGLTASENMSGYNRKIKELSSGYNDSLQIFAQSRDEYKLLTDAQKSFVTSYINGFSIVGDETEEDFKKMREDIGSFIVLLSENGGLVGNYINKLFSIDANSSTVQEYLNTVTELVNTIAGILGKDPVDLMKMLGLTDTTDQHSVMLNHAKRLLSDEYDHLADGLSIADLEILYTINAADGSMTFDSMLAEIDALSHVKYEVELTPLSDLTSEYKTAYDLLSTAQKEMAEGGLTAETITALSQAEKDYINYLYEENGVIKLNTEAWKENAQAKLNTEKEKIQKAIDSLNEENELLYSRYYAAGVRDASPEEYADIAEQINKNNESILKNQQMLMLYDSVFAELSADTAKYFGYAFKATEDGADKVERSAENIKEALDVVWNSDDYKEVKDQLQELADSLDGITPEAIEELATEGSILAGVLEEDGMNAQFLAKILQSMAKGGNGLSLITKEALILNDALDGMAKEFDKVSDARDRFNKKTSVPEKDEDFRAFAEAHATLEEEFKKGHTNSNAFWASAEMLFGKDLLDEWGWQDGLDQIYEALKELAPVFGDADSAASGFLDRLYEADKAGKLVNENGEKLLEISKDEKTGGYTFGIDQKNIAQLATAMGESEESVLACLKALDMWGEVRLFNTDEVIKAIDEIGISFDTTEKKLVNADRLVEWMAQCGKSEPEIKEVVAALQELDGVELVHVKGDIDELVNSLGELGVVKTDGASFTVDYEALGRMLSSMKYTKEEAQQVLYSLEQVNGVSFANAEGEIKGIEDAFDFLDRIHFDEVENLFDDLESDATTVEETLASLSSMMDDFNASSTSEVRSEFKKTRSEIAKNVNEVKSLIAQIDRLNAKRVSRPRTNSDIYTDLSENQMPGENPDAFKAYADGSYGTRDEKALVGEYEPELVVSGDKAYLAGTHGPEVVQLRKGDMVFSGEETRAIFRRSGQYIKGTIPAYGQNNIDNAVGGAYGQVIMASNKTGTNGIPVVVGTDTRELEEKLKKLLDEMSEKLADIIGDYEHQIFLMQKNGYDYTHIVRMYKKMQDEVHAQANKYRELGLDENSDYIQDLQKQWWSYEEAITEVTESVFQEAMDQAHASLDEIQSVFDLLTDAAQQYAESGYFTVDTLQEILSLGTEYLSLLTDENGQLVVNTESIKRVTEARTQQMAVETALSYIQSLRTALTDKDTAALNRLLNVTASTTNSMWGLVYAQLAALNLNETQYRNALRNINTLRSLTDTAVKSIGQISEASGESLQDTANALDDILKYVIEMIEQEFENYIDSLEQQIEDYQEIVDLQKESLELAKEQDDYNKTVSDKLKNISELQRRIQQLSLDDSREAQAEKIKLEEELAELQDDLAETQADKAYDATIDSLDKQADAFEEEKQKEIEMVEQQISSYQKLYDLAIARIETQWGTLLQQLTAWNYEYGNETTQTIVDAWSKASAAVQQYGSYLAAVQGTQAALNASTAMNQGSLYLGEVGDYSSDTEAGNQIHTLVSQMKANSQAWWNDPSRRQYYEEENVRLADQLSQLLGRRLVKGSDGHWYLDTVNTGERLYDKYHEGGIVGGVETPKDNEVLSLLEKGEVVLDDEKKDGLYRIVDFTEKYGDAIEKLNKSVFGENIFGSFASKLVDSIKSSGEQLVSKISYGSVSQPITVNAPLTIQGDVDKDTWSKIYPVLRDHPKQVAEITCHEVMSVFNRRGIRK